MITQRHELLNVLRLPGRLDAQETAYLLGFGLADIPILVAHRILKPLGKPATNGVRYFASEDIDQLRRDVKWLSKASAVMTEHWRARNSRLAKRPRSNTKISDLANLPTKP
jgi:hypothetical protein